MKIAKTLIILATFLIMLATLGNIFIYKEVDVDYKNIPAYISVGVMGILLLSVIFLSFQQGKVKKLKVRLEQKEKENLLLQTSLEDARTKNVVETEPQNNSSIKGDIEM